MIEHDTEITLINQCQWIIKREKNWNHIENRCLTEERTLLRPSHTNPGKNHIWNVFVRCSRFAFQPNSLALSSFILFTWFGWFFFLLFSVSHPNVSHPFIDCIVSWNHDGIVMDPKHVSNVFHIEKPVTEVIIYEITQHTVWKKNRIFFKKYDRVRVFRWFHIHLKLPIAMHTCFVHFAQFKNWKIILEIVCIIQCYLFVMKVIRIAYTVLNFVVPFKFLFYFMHYR